MKNFVYSMYSLKFLPFITKPTRFPSGNQAGCPSLLDHVWYNRCSNINSGIIIYEKIDHFPIFFQLNGLNVEKPQFEKVTFRDHSDVNVNTFIRECNLVDWTLYHHDVNRNTENFCRIVNNLYFKQFPKKTKFLSHKRLCKPWLSSALLKSIKAKTKYYKELK